MKRYIVAALALSPALLLAAQAQPPQRDIPTARDLTPKMPAPVAPFEWAYPVAPPNLPRPDMTALHTAEGADPSIKLTMRQIGEIGRASCRERV